MVVLKLPNEATSSISNLLHFTPLAPLVTVDFFNCLRRTLPPGVRLTSEYVGGSASSEVRSLDSDTESLDSRMSDFEIGQAKKKASFTKFVGSFGKNAKTAAKKLTDEMKDKIHKTKEEKQEEKLGRLATDITNTDGVRVVGNAANDQGFKRIQAHKSGPFDFQRIQFGQDLSRYYLHPKAYPPLLKCYLPRPAQPPPGPHLVYEVLAVWPPARHGRPGLHPAHLGAQVRCYLV